jgi:hypothetical protein
MKADHLGVALPRRPLAVLAGLLAGALCGLVVAALAPTGPDAEVAAAPAREAGSVFADGPARAVPDMALLSAADVERALPPAHARFAAGAWHS